MKAKILTITALIVSVLFIGMNNAACDDIKVTDNSKNESVTANGETKTWVNDGITGNEMQAIKVAVYRKDGTKVPQTSVAYIKLRDGYGKNITNTCSCGDKYSFSSMPSTTNCKCTKNSSVDVITMDGITGTKKYWATKTIYDTAAPDLTTLLTKSNYANIYKILEKIGYKVGETYKYKQGDYLIVEPYVTVSCTTFVGVNKSSAKKYISGTINALVGANMSFLDGQACGETVTEWQEIEDFVYYIVTKEHRYIKFPKKISPQKYLYKWVYSAIGQSFKVENAVCKSNKKSDYSSNHKIYLLNKDSYSGCGYNKFNLDQIVKNKYYCTTYDGDYYDINGNNLKNDAAAQKTSCTCIQKTASDGKTKLGYLTYTDYTNNKTASDSEWKKQCGGGDETECENGKCPKTCFDTAGNPSRNTRINLYFTCKDDGCIAINGATKKKGDYRNLLNFSAKNTNPCTGGSKYQLYKSCLNVEPGETDTFNVNNLSKYTDTFDVVDNIPGMSTSTYPVFCNSSFVFKRDENLKYPFTTLAGMAYIGGESTQGIIAQGVLTRTCILYLPKITNTTEDNKQINKYKNKDLIGDYEYKSDIGDVVLGDKVLEYTLTTKTEPIKIGTNSYYNNYYVYTKIYTANYLMPLRYLDTNGKVTNTKTSIKTYGYYSNFDDNGSYTLGFSIDIKNKGIEVRDEGDCSYEAFNSFSDLKIQFRTIDTQHPFVGENGKTRKTGYNWCDGDNCNYNNSVVKNYINDRNNSYNKANTAPLYKIVLTPDTINTIRNLNSNIAKNNNQTKCNFDDQKCKTKLFTAIRDNITVGAENLIPQ